MTSRGRSKARKARRHARPADSGRRRIVGRARRTVLTTRSAILGAGGLATAGLAVFGLIFLLSPGLKPCVGSASATFFRPTVRKTAGSQAIVSYTVQTNGYKGQQLDLLWTLLRRQPDGVFASVDGFKRQKAATLSPQQCARDQGGGDIPVLTTTPGAYEVLLELFPPHAAARITYVYTPSFTLVAPRAR